MFFRCLFLMMSVLLVAAADPQDDPAKADREKIQGTWLVEKGVEEGAELTKEWISSMKVIITGDKIAFQAGKGRDEKVLFKLDSTQKPKAIDFTSTGDDKVQAKGIYQLDGG